MTAKEIAKKHINEEIATYKLMNAKFDSVDQYGDVIHQGDKCYYDARNRRAIHPDNVRRYAAAELVIAFDPTVDEEDLLYDRETTRQVQHILLALAKR